LPPFEKFVTFTGNFIGNQFRFLLANMCIQICSVFCWELAGIGNVAGSVDCSQVLSQYLSISMKWEFDMQANRVLLLLHKYHENPAAFVTAGCTPAWAMQTQNRMSILSLDRVKWRETCRVSSRHTHTQRGHLQTNSQTQRQTQRQRHRDTERERGRQRVDELIAICMLWNFCVANWLMCRFLECQQPKHVKYLAVH